MSQKEFYKTIYKIAFPVMIQYFIISSLNFMDSFMIGRLGEEAVAGLGIANQYFLLFNLILMGVYSGCNVLISQFFGKKDFKNIKKVLGISLIIGIILAVIFTLVAKIATFEIIKIFNQDPMVLKLGAKYLKIVSLSYLFMAISFAFGIGSRGVRQAFLPMICSVVALFINVFFNYGLIFGNLGMPQLGVSGAAYATLIARIIEMICILALVYLKGSILKSSKKELFDFDKSFFDEVMKVTIPVVINELCWGFGMIIYSVIYGNMSTKAIASVQICMTIQNMFLIILFGISNAACVVIGNEIGNEDLKKAKLYAKKFIRLCIIVSIVIAICLAFSSKYILSIYEVSKEVYMSTFYMLITTAFIFPIRFLNVLLIVGILRGGGDTSYALKIELFTMWLIGVPICYLGAFYLNLKVEEVFLIVTLEEIIKMVLSLRRYKSKKWIRNLVSNVKMA